PAPAAGPASGGRSEPVRDAAEAARGAATDPPRDPRPARIEDPLPAGAPMVRKPKRSNPRLTAVMMAIQGSPREHVADHLAREHGLEDSEELLDEVFGRDEART
ncbi:MAG: hypothetical protein ACJ760_09370, partial [Thermoleophilaceae bacterium]